MTSADSRRPLLRWAKPVLTGTGASLPLGWIVIAPAHLGAAGTGGRGDEPPDLGGQAGEFVLEAAGGIGAAEPADIDDGLARGTGPGAHEHPPAPDQEGQEQACENRDPGHQGGKLPGIVRDREAEPLPVPER